MILVLKRHDIGDGRIMLAVADKLLVGRVLEEGEKRLDLASPFYQGVKASEEEIAPLARVSFTMHFVGAESVTLAKRLGLADDSAVLRVSGVPFVQIVRM